MTFIKIALYKYRSIPSIYGIIIDPHYDQLPFDLIVELVDHCTGIAEVRLRIRFRGPFLERPGNLPARKAILETMIRLP